MEGLSQLIGGWWSQFTTFLVKFESHSLLGDRSFPCLVRVESLHVYHLVGQGTLNQLQTGNQYPLIFSLKNFVRRTFFNYSKTPLVEMGIGAWCHREDYLHQSWLLMIHLSTRQIGVVGNLLSFCKDRGEPTTHHPLLHVK